LLVVGLAWLTNVSIAGAKVNVEPCDAAAVLKLQL